MSGKDVHTEHCCIIHGCRYGDKDCTVTNKNHPQSYPCQTCMDDKSQNLWESQSYIRTFLYQLKAISSPIFLGKSNLVERFTYKHPYDYEQIYSKKTK